VSTRVRLPPASRIDDSPGMGFADWWKGKGKTTQRKTPEIRRPDDFVTAWDERGRELKIRRRDWVTSVLQPRIEEAWNDAEALSSTIVQALRDDLVEQVAAAAERLVAIDARSERALVLVAIVRMETGDLDGAEQALKTSIEEHEETGVVLTNLAKVMDRRGQKEQSHATLRRALERDPNQESGLLWWAALAQEAAGNPQYVAALEEIARLPGAWRPQLWLAREALKRGDRAAAVELYDQVLSVAADEADVLIMVTGDLGKSGDLEDLVRLAAPRYQPERHGPPAGMNLIQAWRQLGRVEEARTMVRKLQAMGWAPLAGRLAQLDGELAAALLPNDQVPVPQITAADFEEPIWTWGLSGPDWLFTAPDQEAPSITLFTLANELAVATSAQVQVTDDLGRLTRAIPLYLAEVLQLRHGGPVRCKLLIVEGHGPAVFATEFPRQVLEATLPPARAPRLVVTGSVAGSGLRLELWEAGTSGAPVTIGVEGSLADVGALVGRAERALTGALMARGLRLDARPPRFHHAPPPELLGGYVSALEQLFYQLLVVNELASAQSLWNERGFFETYFSLVDSWPSAPDSARLIAICGVLAGARYQSAILDPYRKLVLKWLDEAPAGGVLGRLAPAVWKRLGESTRLDAWSKHRPLQGDAAYAGWLARVLSEPVERENRGGAIAET
jgi:tetratricopeptide (TPR) repeat protein